MKKIIIVSFCLIAAVTLTYTAWAIGDVIPSGVTTTQNRPLSDFIGVNASGAVELDVAQGSGFSVAVETDENVQPYIITEVKDGILKIYTREHTDFNNIKVHVSVKLPKLQSLELSGASKGTAKDISTDKLDVTVSGASHLKLDAKATDMRVITSGASQFIAKGSTGTLTCKVSGASELSSASLLADNVNVDCSGASHTKISVNKSLAAKASGASHIEYSGSPAQIDRKATGASEIEKID